MDAYVALRRSALFAEIDDALLRKLAQRCSVRALDAGDILVRAGSPQRDVVYVAEGSLVLYRRNPRQDVAMALGVVSAPSLFGDAEWAAGVPWMISARAETAAAAVMIDNAAYERLAQQHPAVAYRLYRDACVRHLLANHTAQMMAIYDVETRLLRLLLDHAGRAGERSGDELVLEDVGPVALAASLGVNRRTITRALAALEKQGWLEREGRKWRLKKLASMEAHLPSDMLGFSTKSGEHGPLFSRWSGQLNEETP